MNKNTLLNVTAGVLVLLAARGQAQAGMRGTKCTRIVTDVRQDGDCTPAQFAADLKSIGIEPGDVSQFGTPLPEVKQTVIYRKIGNPIKPKADCEFLVSRDVDSCERVACQLDKLEAIKKSHPGDALGAMGDVFGKRFIMKPLYRTKDDACIAEKILALPGVGDYELASGFIDAQGHLPVFKAAALRIASPDNDIYRAGDEVKPVVLSCKLGILAEYLLAERMGYGVVTSWPFTLGTPNCQLPWKGMFNY